MSLRINTNVSAMTSLRSLGKTEAKLADSITRLSTGLRINSGGDDPAGLVISEGLRAQIAGLEQAIKNSQDAVTMVKTADGALDEVQSLLRGIRGLAVHAANTAVVDSQQLQANQAKIRSVLQSVDRIASSAAFGRKKLLDGSSGASVGLTRTDLLESLYIGSTFNGQTVAAGQIQMTRVTQATKASVTLSNSYANASTAVNAGSFVINGVTFTVQANQTVTDVANMINEKADLTNVRANIAGAGPVQLQLQATKYGSNFGINYLEGTNILNNAVSPAAVYGVNARYDVTAPIEGGTATETFTGGQGPGVDGLTLTSASGNRMVLTETGNTTSAATTVGAMSVGSMQFQVGANAGEMISFSLPKMFANELGRSAVAGKSLSGIDVTTAQGAQDAIRIIDAAIDDVSRVRGSLGSFQTDFLESTVRSLGVATENMTAVESQVRDVDYAKEMTEFTKVQVLRQSGLAILAQASRSPQQVLQLIQGG